jgi:hypothetical protein
MADAQVSAQNIFFMMKLLLVLEILIVSLSALTYSKALSAVYPLVSGPRVGDTEGQNNVLILDHLNINHEKSRHDWLGHFMLISYSAHWILGRWKMSVCAKKTIWANTGSHQFHLPEGKPEAQVLDEGSCWFTRICQRSWNNTMLQDQLYGDPI